MLEPLYTADEMKAAEAGHDVPTLMERAGRAVAEEALRSFPDARTFALFAGRGANGGDGKIAARILTEEHGLERVDDGAELVIDALLGNGMRGAPRDDAAAAIGRINAAGAPVLAVDIPSGVNASTGEVEGAAVEADVTVTMHGSKVGLAVGPGRFRSGDVIVVDIGLEPHETEHALVTRDILEIFKECRHPVSIVTKGALILRDLELLADLARDHLVSVMVSVTSLDPEIKRTLEPRAASPQARLRIIEALAQAGVPVGVLVAPVIPVITDHELEDIVSAAAKAGARSAGYVVLRLPHEVKTLFREWLAEHYPLRAEHVMSVIGSLRGGRDNDPRFGTRMRGEGPFAELLRNRFRLAVQRAGLNGRSQALSTSLFRPPRPETPQLDLGL